MSMSAVIGMFMLVVLVSVLVSVSTIAVVWLIWLRNTRQVLADTQKTLSDTKASLDKLVALQQAYMGGTPPPVPLLDEDGEAADIIESDVDGMFIRLPPDVSPQERERIIHYLKSEGFISDE